jgi:hypothetical protein
VAHAQDHRAVRWLERAALCLAVLFLCAHTLPRAWRTLNTDFPNYYLAARLAHERYDTSRMYEWRWIEREKDHRAVDIRVIGLLPITPFSTLAMWPETGLAPLDAKRIWILLNLVLLVPIGWMLRSMTGLNSRRIAPAFLLSFPLHRNLLYGQFYVLLLLLIVAACWSYLRGFRAVAGALLALAAVCKIFPVLLFLFFLQRRDWRALASGAITGLSAIAVSVAIFGLNANRIWLHEILPWAMHGEAMPPYVPSSASFSSLLHCLFLSEPQWNPHPWHSSPFCYALLLPTLQMLTFAPAILLIRRRDRSEGRILLEWSALLTAALAISTLPASYNFVLMVFPACLLAASLLQRKRHGWLAALVVVYLGIGFPVPNPSGAHGLALLLYMPRLPLMLALLLGSYVLLWQDNPQPDAVPDWSRYIWIAAMTAAVVFGAGATLHLERGERQEYAYRLPLQTQGYLNASPQPAGTGIRYIAFSLNGYHLITQDGYGVRSDPSTDSSYDDLSFASRGEDIWVERASSPQSEIVNLSANSRLLIENAREPMLSTDGQSLAFLRDNHGRGRLMLAGMLQSGLSGPVALTPPQVNVYEASFLSAKDYVFSAAGDGEPPQIYLTDATHVNSPIPLTDSRYPALSPDGRWMAYSHLAEGVWNLWLRDQATGTTRRIADVPCNQIEPAWQSDSRTLLYATDCGRSLWFTAIARRKVIP